MAQRRFPTRTSLLTAALLAPLAATSAAQSAPPHTTPVAATATATTTRWRHWRSTPKANKAGSNRPMATHKISLMGNKGCSSISRRGSHSSIAESSSTWAKKASKRSSTWPRPNITGAGNNKAKGQTANKASAPLESGTNQRSRKRLHRSIQPAQAKARAVVAPASAPAMFRAASTLEGTRTGKNIWMDSKVKDKTAAAVVAMTTAGHSGRVRCNAKANKNPNGA